MMVLDRLDCYHVSMSRECERPVRSVLRKNQLLTFLHTTTVISHNQQSWRSSVRVFECCALYYLPLYTFFWLSRCHDVRDIQMHIVDSYNNIDLRTSFKIDPQRQAQTWTGMGGYS